MSKFPDPTKNYEATPVPGAIDLQKTEPAPIYQTPTPPPTPPQIPTPSKSSAPTVTHQGGGGFRNIIPIILGLGALILLVVLGMALIPKFTKKTTPITLNYWGLWEPASVMQAVIADYESTHPNVKINYSMQSPKNYRSRIFASNNASSAPDIIRIHNTWLPMLKKNLAPAPNTLLTVSDLSDFYPVVQKDFVIGNQIYALPLEVDGLVLLYNQDIFSEAGLTPPSDWNTLRKVALDLTRTNPNTGIIERAGIAMGTTNNVEHWSDILGLLILQNSGNPGVPTETAVSDALTFYTIFSTDDHSWDASQPNSVYAFATGTVGMILAPSWQINEIKVINPELNFGVVPAPILPTANLAWATYWAEAVPSTSKNPAAAWEFIKYLSSPEALQKMYAGASAIRGLGEPYPRVSLANLLSEDPLAASVVNQAPNYTSWYLSGRTYDEGINDQLIKYYEDAVNAINGGSGVGGVVTTLGDGVAQVLAKFPDAK